MNVDPCLAAYGVAVATGAPYLLRRHSATEGTPRLGVAAWFLGAGTVLASWLAAGVSLVHHPGAAAQTAGVFVVGGLTARLAWAWTVTWRTNRASRIRHVRAAALLGHPDAATGAVVVDSPQAAVYCMPSLGGGTIVVTTGARVLLSSRELNAVLSHERAHLVGRHHLLVGLGQTLARALPPLLLFRQLALQVPRLLEMRADDAAARIYGGDTVARAIATLSRSCPPAGALGAGGSAATIRALRLTGTEVRSWRSQLSLSVTVLFLSAGPYLATLSPCPHPW
jgi:Zn-dependent protease with chaperone function